MSENLETPIGRPSESGGHLWEVDTERDVDVCRRKDWMEQTQNEFGGRLL
jgi:hypothetical protein